MIKGVNWKKKHPFNIQDSRDIFLESFASFNKVKNTIERFPNTLNKFIIIILQRLLNLLED